MQIVKNNSRPTIFILTAHDNVDSWQIDNNLYRAIIW